MVPQFALDPRLDSHLKEDDMGLISLIVTLALIGLVLWLVITYIPMPEPFKRIIVVVVAIVVILYVARVLLGWSGSPLLR